MTRSIFNIAVPSTYDGEAAHRSIFRFPIARLAALVCRTPDKNRTESGQEVVSFAESIAYDPDKRRGFVRTPQSKMANPKSKVT